MAKIIETGASERRPIDIIYYDKDGSPKDLDGWTITPQLNEHGAGAIYLTGVDAGSITETDYTVGTFSFLPAANIFVEGKMYDLLLKFVNGSISYFIKAGVIIKVVR